MNKIFLINFPSDHKNKFGDELLKELVNLDMEVARDFAENYLMDLGNGRDILPDLVYSHSNKSVECKDAKFFFRMRESHNVFLSALLCQFVSLVGGVRFNQKYDEHQKNTGKAAQAINLVRHKLPIPRTLLVSGAYYSSFQEYIESALSYPMVVKGDGSGGNQVWKVDSFDEIKSRIKDIEKDRKEVLIFQEYIPTSDEEYRIVFFNGEVIARVSRSSDTFYNNAAQGGRVAQAQVTESELQLARKVAGISGMDYLSVDYMRLKGDSVVFIEVQTGPSMNVTKKVNPNAVGQIANLLARGL